MDPLMIALIVAVFTLIVLFFEALFTFLLIIDFVAPFLIA